jgi:signal transduction histidine kinase
MARRSVTFPVTLGFVLSVLALVLAVSWVLVLFADRPVAATGLTSLDWVLLVLGIALFALIIVGLVWLCAWLVREMRLNQRQHAFLDAVTHEMKTPLASMRLYLETLVKHDPPRDNRSEFLGRMAEDLERLEQTVDRVEDRDLHLDRVVRVLHRILQQVSKYQRKFTGIGPND